MNKINMVNALTILFLIFNAVVGIYLVNFGFSFLDKYAENCLDWSDYNVTIESEDSFEHKLNQQEYSFTNCGDMGFYEWMFKLISGAGLVIISFSGMVIWQIIFAKRETQ